MDKSVIIAAVSAVAFCFVVFLMASSFATRMFWDDVYQNRREQIQELQKTQKHGPPVYEEEKDNR